jgi:hypothetical protein
VALFLIVIWIPNMRRKDRSLARYPAFAQYKPRTFMLIPRLTTNKEEIMYENQR